jgi:hypothetical protein
MDDPLNASFWITQQLTDNMSPYVELKLIFKMESPKNESGI